jgi:hypothetical protein
MAAGWTTLDVFPVGTEVSSLPAVPSVATVVSDQPHITGVNRPKRDADLRLIRMSRILQVSRVPLWYGA